MDIVTQYNIVFNIREGEVMPCELNLVEVFQPYLMLMPTILREYCDTVCS